MLPNMRDSTPDTPFDEDLEEHLSDLRKYLKAPVRYAALRFLLHWQREGRFDRTQHPTLKSREVLQAFYDYSINNHISSGGVQTKNREPDEIQASVVDREKQVFTKLAHVLEQFYAKPIGRDAPIKVEIQRGQGALYEPLVERRGKSGSGMALPAHSVPLSGATPSQGVTIYPDWDKFQALLGSVQRNDADTEDIRIVTMGFKNHEVPADTLFQLANRNRRLSIMLTDPEACEDLVRTRSRIRYRYDHHETEELALKSISEQIRQLRDLSHRVADLRLKQSCEGSLEVHLSNLMPYGFAAMAPEFVILGVFLATGSYGEGPMIVVDLHANPSLADALRKDWDARLAYASERTRAEEAPPSTTEGVLPDVHFIGAIEAKAPQGTKDIWVVAPDLANVGETRSRFSDQVRKAVSANAARGISYTYICPRGQPGKARIRNLRECFVGTPGKLFLHQIPLRRFREITLVDTHFLILNPHVSGRVAYMQLPLGGAQKGWIKLSASDAQNIVAKMKTLIPKHR